MTSVDACHNGRLSQWTLVTMNACHNGRLSYTLVKYGTKTWQQVSHSTAAS